MKALLLEQGTTWVYPFLELVYQAFNAPGVPRDMGPASILSTDKFWDKLPAALGGWQDVTDFLTMISRQTRAPQLHIQERRHDLCRRIQLVIFWTVFTQKAHTSPKTCLRTLRERGECCLSMIWRYHVVKRARAWKSRICCTLMSRSEDGLPLFGEIVS